MIIRKAKIHEILQLSELAFQSKAYWGYTDDFMEKCKDDLTVTPCDIEEKHVYVLEDNDKLLAFYSLELNPNRLDAFFIKPDYIGKGIGKLLWRDVMDRAKKLNIEEFTLDSEPNAEGFYKKMGAKRIGEISSTVFQNRKLPLMKVMVH
ncbi:GNAT family N-acetyltransferase [Bacillus sp. PK3_68]|uniref:GNAT family N-acetyltransferase n=1 Tax=Bacillus sp. PK3_68 TaxID=2027408 RepID=UPI000E761410|nr:GNAT family N-acetyltransferase [Bacillus sp. PK3_68]RJS59054.1 GNAT family N-acetyltransferase [Bacillus sp. PK3_68]